MRIIRTCLVAATLAASGLIGFATPAHACVWYGPLGAKDCTWVASCSVTFAGDQNVPNYESCLL